MFYLGLNWSMSQIVQSISIESAASTITGLRKNANKGISQGTIFDCIDTSVLFL